MDNMWMVFYTLAVALGWILSSWITNMRWIDAAEANTFIMYNKKMYKVDEIKVEEVEDEVQTK